MAKIRVSRTQQNQLVIHEDDTRTDHGGEDVYMDESRDPLEESGCTRTDDSDADEEIDDAVAEDIARLEESFRGINKRYRLINRIGEGVFALSATSANADQGHQVHSRLCIRRKIYYTTCTRTIGI